MKIHLIKAGNIGDKVARSKGFEPLTPGTGNLCSIQLSYERIENESVMIIEKGLSLFHISGDKDDGRTVDFTFNVFRVIGEADIFYDGSPLGGKTCPFDF